LLPLSFFGGSAFFPWSLFSQSREAVFDPVPLFYKVPIFEPFFFPGFFLQLDPTLSCPGMFLCLSWFRHRLDALFFLDPVPMPSSLGGFDPAVLSVFHWMLPGRGNPLARWCHSPAFLWPSKRDCFFFSLNGGGPHFSPVVALDLFPRLARFSLLISFFSPVSRPLPFRTLAFFALRDFGVCPVPFFLHLFSECLNSPSLCAGRICWPFFPVFCDFEVVRVRFVLA